MIETAYAQLRTGLAAAFGIAHRTAALDRIIRTLLATRKEFGSIGAEGAELLELAPVDVETARELQLRRFRKAAKLAATTRYYGDLGIDARRLEWEDVERLPLTPKHALRADPAAFVARGATPGLRALTTGTTGVPTTVYFSHEELEVAERLAAIDFLIRGVIGPDDVVQISTSSRGVQGVLVFAGACMRVGATVVQAGFVEPRLGLALLAEGATVLSTSPSYLGALVEEAAGYGPRDFRLRRIVTGGELLSAGLAARAREVFGDVAIDDVYNSTESLPLGGIHCSQGHLHFPLTGGLVEVRSLEEPRAARPGEPGTIVLTPFTPFRTTTCLLRYDTEDVVHAIAPPTCELAGAPATGPLVGKRALSIRSAHGWTFQRAVLEALESLACVPLPARFGFRPVRGGVAVEVVARDASPATRRVIAAALAEVLPLASLHIHTDPRGLRMPIPVRADLRETSLAEIPLRGAA